MWQEPSEWILVLILGELFNNTVQASKQALNKEIYSQSPEDKYYKSTMQLSCEVSSLFHYSGAWIRWV